MSTDGSRMEGRLMASESEQSAGLPQERILLAINVIRGQRVMLDADLALLYGVEVRALNQAVKRNIARFPEDFALQLTDAEFAGLRSQIVISSWGGRRYLPYAFTEQGVCHGPPARRLGRSLRLLLARIPAHGSSTSTSRSCVPSSSCGGRLPGTRSFPGSSMRSRRGTTVSSVPCLTLSASS